MKDINSVKYIQELLKKQKQFMRNVMIMQQKLFDIQSRISELTYRELMKKDVKEVEKSDLLSSNEVCRLYKISQSTLYRMRTENDLPFVKIEGRKKISYYRKDIEDYYKKHKPNKS